MHYSNGRAAKAGDVVRGKGYNIKHEIVGLLIAANPGSSSCNCTVATVTAGSLVLTATLPDQKADDVIGLKIGEACQLDAFVAIDPKTGEVLPPE